MTQPQSPYPPNLRQPAYQEPGQTPQQQWQPYQQPYRQQYQPYQPQYQPAAALPQRLPLMRPKRGRLLCGVCRGLSMHLGVSVWLLRLLFVIVTFVYGAGAVAYLFLWLFVPAGDPVEAAQRAARPAAQAPLSHGNAAYDGATGAAEGTDDANGTGTARETIAETLRNAPKPALFAVAGVAMLGLGLLLSSRGIDVAMIIPISMAASGIAVAWLRYDARDGQLLSMLGGIALIFGGYAFFVVFLQWQWDSPTVPLAAGLAMLAGVGLAIVPWINSLIRDLGTERALKEREEERADMTAHLHDGVLQTLALIQLHSEEPTTVFTLARQQERELREWLYQERTTSDRSVNAGLKDIAARVEDEHGKPIEVVTVGDARPSAQTDALLDATQQALINAVTHGGEPISVYCEADGRKVEVFVRDHGDGFDVHAIPEGRLGIRESIIRRIRRRGGTVGIVSRPGWGTEVRMHMPIVAERGAERGTERGTAAEQTRQQTNDHAA